LRVFQGQNWVGGYWTRVVMGAEQGDKQVRAEMKQSKECITAVEEE